jgi:hypothetical protein
MLKSARPGDGQVRRMAKVIFRFYVSFGDAESIMSDGLQNGFSIPVCAGDCFGVR